MHPHLIKVQTHSQRKTMSRVWTPDNVGAQFDRFSALKDKNEKNVMETYFCWGVVSVSLDAVYCALHPSTEN